MRKNCLHSCLLSKNKNFDTQCQDFTECEVKVQFDPNFMFTYSFKHHIDAVELLTTKPLHGSKILDSRRANDFNSTMWCIYEQCNTLYVLSNGQEFGLNASPLCCNTFLSGYELLD